VAAALNPALLAAVFVMILLPHRKRLMLRYLADAYAISMAAGLAIVFTLHGSGAVTTSGCPLPGHLGHSGMAICGVSID
jgi:hypothetical protein